MYHFLSINIHDSCCCGCRKKRLEQMKKQLKERGAIYMSKVIRKRVSALLMSAVMATSSVAVASGSFMVANAAEGETVNIGKTLATSIPNPDDKDNPLNADKCTYL